ncbi:aminotransferase class V-fold PLP-dependent enzyme [Thermogutta sp.]|uniref:aminotransferase class V-fold PLP-dependent enzyme n=1 Tax=Thermogutta sp. TaxID=1962930 RepID=UPI0032208D25
MVIEKANDSSRGDVPSVPWWRDFRSHMPVCQRWIYFDHAAVSPLPDVSRDAIVRWAHQAAEMGDVVWKQWAGILEQLRASAAQFLGASPREIALVRNTSHGISIVAEGFPWRAGDNVVIPADEFPANQYPWLALRERGVEVRRVPPREGRVRIEDLLAACDSRTRILSVSWVSYHLGWRHNPGDLAEIAHRVGAYFFLDAIQGLGVFPIDVRDAGIDFLAADGHKWLLGPEGAGILFVREPLWEILRPTSLGWNSVEHPFDFDRIEFRLKPSAARYEGGSANMVGFIGLHSSLQLLQTYGVEGLQNRVLDLTDYLVERLAKFGLSVASDRTTRDHASGIVAVDWPTDSLGTIHKKLLERGVVVSARSGRLRLSPHAYNDLSDVDTLVDSLAEILRSQ